jgi:hypothetical protein
MSKNMARNAKLVAASLALMSAMGLSSGCRVRQTEDGKIPEVQVKDGKMPKYDVDTAKVDVKKEKVEVEVPKVKVTMPPENPKPPSQ